MRAARLQLYTWGATDCPHEKRQIWKMKNANTRPHFVQFNRCKNVRWEGVRVRESPFWTLHLYQCENVSVRGFDVKAHGNNMAAFVSFLPERMNLKMIIEVRS